jgi:hypothetical protein
MAAEAQADKTMAMSAPSPNPRMERLKQLWAQTLREKALHQEVTAKRQVANVLFRLNHGG